SRHVAADSRDHEADDQNERNGDQRQCQCTGCEYSRFREGECEPCGDGKAGGRQYENPLRCEIAIAVVCGGRNSGSGERADQSAHNWLGKHEKRVDRGDTNGASADESYLRAPDRRRVRCQSLANRGWLHRREDRNRDHPRDYLTDQHRHSDGQSNELTGTEQRERPRDVVSSRRSRSESNDTGELAGYDPRSAHDGETGRRDGAKHDSGEPFPCLARIVLRLAARARSHLQHFGCRDTFGIWQVGVRHQSAPERNGEYHAKYAAAKADEERFPEWKASPPANDHQCRQDEDDGRERAGRGCHRLNDVVLEDGRVLHRTQESHRYHRRGNRRREGEAHLEAEVNVGSREDSRDEGAENQPAYRQLFWFHAVKLTPKRVGGESHRLVGRTAY